MRLRNFIALPVAALMLSACGDSSQVAFVKGGTLDLCPGTTVEEMVDSFMGSPEWESGNDGSVDFVNVWGDITYHEAPVRALVQFLVDEDSGRFEFNAMEFNDVPQADFLAMALLGKMCESTR